MKTICIAIHSGDIRAWMQRDHGIEVSRRRLNYATANGFIPRPLLTASGDHAWRPKDLPAVVRYFKNPRRPGRPRTKAS